MYIIEKCLRQITGKIIIMSLTKLQVDIDTDGTLDAEEILRISATILQHQLSAFAELGRLEEVIEEKNTPDVKDRPSIENSKSKVSESLEILNSSTVDNNRDSTNSDIEASEDEILNSIGLSVSGLIDTVKEILVNNKVPIEWVIINIIPLTPGDLI